MDMDTLDTRNGKPEKWISGTLSVRRCVAAVRGNAVTLEVPLMDSYDSKYLGDGAVAVSRIAVTGQPTEVGVEDLRVSAPPRTAISPTVGSSSDGMVTASSQAPCPTHCKEALA